MVIKETVIETVEQEVVRDVLCNKCGESLKTSMGNFEGLVEARVVGGYGAKLGDGTPYQFSVCEDCLGEFFRTFKHQPINPDDYEGGFMAEPEPFRG